MIMLLELEAWLKKEADDKFLFNSIHYHMCLMKLREIKAAYACESLKEAGY